MVGQYKVITLCGSTRFKDAFMREQKRLTLEGNIVISVGLFGHSGDEEVWEGMGGDTITKTKMMLDDMHKRKIDMADEIFVINENGYIGDSTKSEIAYAEANGKTVNYLTPLVADSVERKEFLDKELYEGDDVICKEPWDYRIIDGYSGAFCECGHVLHIKTPRRKAFHAIKCPICGQIVNLFCGEEGKNLSTDDIRAIMPNIDGLGD